VREGSKQRRKQERDLRRLIGKFFCYAIAFNLDSATDRDAFLIFHTRNDQRLSSNSSLRFCALLPVLHCSYRYSRERSINDGENDLLTSVYRRRDELKIDKFYNAKLILYRSRPRRFFRQRQGCSDTRERTLDS